MKRCLFALLILLLAVWTFTFLKTEEVGAFDFASDFFTPNNVEITPNSSVPLDLGITDYRYGMRLSSSKEGSTVSLNDTFVGKFSIDLMPYSSVSYGSTQYETANYSNTYQDLNALSLKFKNKSDSKEFKVVLNGGAQGNNVTVNAHVDLNNDKMGLYYPTTNTLVGNTKGANSNGVYTYLWGTSFSNVAVSSEVYSAKNVKSLKIEFDPITMCVYGYSYGYSKIETERVLIWDLSKETLDGSDPHQTLDSFDEYEVSLCFEDLNAGRTANVLVYSINGQNFSNTAITNNMGPVSYAKLSNGKLNEKYYLPLPKAYDVLEGIIDFSGEVVVTAPNGQIVSLYQNETKATNNTYVEGMYFIPELTGDYVVSYVAKDSKKFNGEVLSQVVSVLGKDTVSFDHKLAKELYYAKGSSFDVPTAKLLIGETSYPTNAVIYSPTNQVITGASNLKLDQEGLYKLIYEATVNGVSYVDEVNIYASKDVKELFELKNCIGQEFTNLDLNNNVYGLVVDTKVETSTVTFKEALDLSYLNGETCLVSMQANPNIWGKNQFSAITIKLIDAADATNYVRVYCSTGSASDQSFVRTGSADQRLAGLSSDGTVSQTSSGGTSIAHSFSGIANNSNIANQNFEVYFDYASKKIYTTNKVLVADLDDSEYFSTLWNGFSGDKFYIEISISGISSEASYLINSVAGMDLDHEYSVDNAKPLISYNESDFIEGVIDTYYSIPTVTVTDANSKNITQNVYVTLNGNAVEVKDNKFLPTELGRYVITYEFVDNFGNISTLVKRVLIRECVDPIVLTVENAEISGFVGETIHVPGYKVSGGSGEVEVVIVATGVNSSEQYVVENLSFVPYVADNYVISYTAFDKLGNENINDVKLNVNVKLSTKPIIEAPAYVPTVLVDGIVTQFAETKAYDYNNASNTNVEVEVYLLIGAEEIKVENYQHELSLDNMNETVVLIYRATSKVTKEVAELRYEIPAVKLYDEDDYLVIPQYLITNGFSDINVTDESIDLTTNTSHSTIEFIKNVYSDGFQIGFNVPAAANNVNKVTIYLTDAEDSNKQIKLDIIKANLTDSFSYLLINDEVKVTIVGTFYGTTANRLKIVYDGSLNAIKDDSGLVVSYLKTYLNGETFMGFGSEINFKIELGDVSGTTIFKLYEIGNQMMSSIDGDYTVPAIVYEDEIERISDINTVVKIPSAKAIDILGFEASLTIRILSPSKNVVYTSNTGEGTDLLVDQYGTYYVYYIGTDDNGNSLNQLKLITVLDDIAPIISLTGEIKSTVKVNDTLTLPGANCTDNVSSSEKIKTRIFTIDPNNVMKEVTSGQVKFEVAGTYTIRYFAIDEAGNVSLHDVTVEVK